MPEEIVDPILEAATRDIEAVYAKHDIAGAAIIHRPGAAKHIAQLSPTWACSKVVDGNLKINAALSEFPDKETQRRVVSNTVEMIVAVQRMAERLGGGMIGMLRLLKKDHHVDQILTPAAGNGSHESRIILPPGTKL